MQNESLIYKIPTTTGPTAMETMMKHHYSVIGSFHNGRRLAFLLFNGSEDENKSTWLNIAPQEDILAAFVRILDQGQVDYDFRNPTKFFDEGITEKEAERLGKTWQTLLELGCRYNQLNALSWKKIREKADMLDVIKTLMTF